MGAQFAVRFSVDGQRVESKIVYKQCSSIAAQGIELKRRVQLLPASVNMGEAGRARLQACTLVKVETILANSTAGSCLSPLACVAVLLVQAGTFLPL